MTGSGSPVDRFERGDSHGVSLLLIFRASRWHEDVPGSSLSVLLERNEETRKGLCFYDVSRVSRLRPSTRSQQGYFSHWRWLNGSGSTSRWIF